jgi:LEA14-like dessication related protein
MRKLALMVGVATALIVSGCALLGSAAFKQPIVNLASVSVRGLGLTGGSLDVMLNVYNPNHYRLDATELNYRVQVANDSVVVASGTLTRHFTVPDGDSTKVTIPVDFTYNGLGAAGRSIINTGTIAYHVLGDVHVGTTVGSFTVPFSSKGRFTTTGLAR